MSGSDWVWSHVHRRQNQYAVALALFLMVVHLVADRETVVRNASAAARGQRNACVLPPFEDIHKRHTHRYTMDWCLPSDPDIRGVEQKRLFELEAMLRAEGAGQHALSAPDIGIGVRVAVIGPYLVLNPRIDLVSGEITCTEVNWRTGKTVTLSRARNVTLESEDPLVLDAVSGRQKRFSVVFVGRMACAAQNVSNSMADRNA